MATEVKLPELAEGVEKGEITDVFVKEGDQIDVDTPLVEVNAEKATLNVPSTIKGRIAKLLVKKGDKVDIGQTLLTVDEGGAAAGAAGKESAPAETSTKKAAATGEKPQPSSSAKKGAAQAPADGDADSESAADRVESTEEPPASHGKKVAAKDTGKSAGTTPQPAHAGNGGGTVVATELIPAGPTVRRIARELGVDLRKVRGSGRGGRITVEDLDPYVHQFVANRAGVAGGGGAAFAGLPQVELPDFSKFGPVRREPADALRRKIAERMSQSWLTVPHVHQFHDADVTELMALMKRQKDRVKQAGGALTFTVFAMKAITLALKEFPKFNSSWDAAGQHIVYKDYYNIGIAVDTDAGLMVPVVRDVDQKTLVQLAIELPQIAERTRNKKNSIDDLRGGSFTISNLGGIGGGHFTPIVNVPEVAILGIGRSRRQAVFNKDGEMTPREICPLVLGYDHRVIDGGEGARFVVRVGEILENFEAAFLGF